MTTPHPPLDVVSVLVAVAAMALGPELAPYVGAYSVIALGAVVGALIAVWRRPPSSRLQVAAFAAVLVVVSVCTTVPAADLLTHYLQIDTARGGQWLLFPVALCLAAIGHDWPRIARWLAATAGRALRLRTGTGDPPQ